MKVIIIFLVIVLSYNSSAQSFKSFTEADGLPSNNVLCASSDREGTIWFGTQRGIAIYNGDNWEVMTTNTHPGLANDNVSSILVATNGTVWAAGDYGASFYDGTSWTTYKAADGLGSSRITNISEIENGHIWLSDFNGATLYDGTSFTAYKTEDGLPFGGVEDVLELDNGNIIMATSLSGIAIYDGKNFSFVTESEGLLSDNTTALLKDKKGNIWVGTSAGVSVFDANMSWTGNHTRMYKMPEPDTLNPVEDLAIDSEGNIWSGIYVDYLVTVGGVAKYDGFTWSDYDNDQGIVGPTIRSLLVDEMDNVWVTTSSGITKISNVSANVDKIDKRDFITYPNPVQDELYLELGDLKKPLLIQLINNKGSIVLEKYVVHTSETTLIVSNLEPGVYTLLVGEITKQIIVFP